MDMLPPTRNHTTGMPPYRWQQVMSLPIFVAALGLYGFTLAPTVVTLFDDSLEFQLVTYQLGIAHPSGYPLYTLLGWLFTRLPVGDVAYRVNLMSAVFGALTVAFVYLIGLELIAGSRWPSGKEFGGSAHQPWIEVLASLIGAASLAVSPVFWSQATVAEVYTLNAAFAAGILWLLVRRRWQEKSHTLSEKRLLALAFLFSLSLTHHRTIVLLLPTIIFYLWRHSKDWRHRALLVLATKEHLPAGLLSTGVKLATALVAPLMLYLYIPLRGHVGSLDGTYTNTLAGFWQHVTASGYGVFIFQNPFGAERGINFYFSLFLKQFGPLGLAAGLVGLVALRRRDVLSLTGIAFITYFAFNLFYRVADIQVFFIPPFLIWAIWVGIAAGWLLSESGSVNTNHLSSLRLLLSLVTVLLFSGQFVALAWENLPVLNRSHAWAVSDYGLDMMRQPLEPGAAIVGILGEVTLVRYFQATEGLRPDLLPVAADREAERLAIIPRLLDEGRAVYLTRELPGAPALWSLNAVGPLIRVNPRPILKAPDTPFIAGSSLTPEVSLHGYAISRPSTHCGVPPVRLTLAWQVTAPITRELKVSVRLYSESPSLSTDGQLVAQDDAVPVHFAYPTTAWRPGEFITDVYDLVLPTTLEPGEYIPVIILYEPTQGAAEVGRLTLPPVHLP
jgi:hypothetical protein